MNTMKTKKYRKKPVVIEAYQTDKALTIHTVEGDMLASKGDYIITGVNGEQYPCKPDVFEKLYEPVEDQERLQPSDFHEVCSAKKILNGRYGSTELRYLAQDYWCQPNSERSEHASTRLPSAARQEGDITIPTPQPLFTNKKNSEKYKSRKFNN